MPMNRHKNRLPKRVEKSPNIGFSRTSKNSRIIDNVSLYAAIARMDKGECITHTQGYKMLREISYQNQKNLSSQDRNNKKGT